MKQKIFDYIEELERKAKESEKYFKLWHKERIKNNKAIEYIEHLRKEWVECSANDNINLYMFETYLNGISKLVALKVILEGKDED